MLTGEMAKYQIQDRVRDAEAARIAGRSRTRVVARRAVARNVASGLLAAVVGLRGRTASTAAQIGVKPA
jgi:hypothetical protein